jgi:hypothetical protein
MIRTTPSPEPWTDEEEAELVKMHADNLDVALQPFNQYCMKLQERGDFTSLLWCLEKMNQWLHLIGHMSGISSMLIQALAKRQGKLH